MEPLQDRAPVPVRLSRPGLSLESESGSEARAETPAETEAAAEPAAPASSPDRAPERATRRRRRRRSRYEERQPPRSAFLKGALLGCVAGIPLFAVFTYALTRGGVRGVAISFEHAFAVVAAFAGPPLILSAGGVGRLAARASVAPDKRGLVSGVIAAARALAVAGVGALLIALIALGAFPETGEAWAIAGAAGLGGGAALGALVGAWAASGGAAPSE